MNISKTLVLAIGSIVIAGVLCSGCRSSGIESGTVPSQPAIRIMMLSGTAAVGAPIASATIRLKDRYGVLKTIDTGTDGKYTVDVTGMIPPFLLQITSAATSTLYSTATETGTVNIHPFTDLIIRNWYKVQGHDIDTDFSGTGELITPPTESEIATIEAVIRSILSTWLTEVGLSSTDFNLLTTPFDANGEGFDKVLDNMKVTIDTTGQVAVTTTDPTWGFGGTTISANIINLIITDVTSPTNPSGLSVWSANAGTLVLQWDSSTDNIGVAGYNVYRDGNKIGASPFPVYTDTGLAASTTYCYQVEAFDGAGNLSFTKSSEACVTASATTDTTAPTVPAGLTATTGPSGNISLAWTTDDTTVLGYKVFRGPTEIAAIIDTSYNDTGLTAGTNYCYTVKAFDAANNISSPSSAACATTLALSIPVTTVWKSSFAGTVFNKTPTKDTTYIAMVMTQSGYGLSGTIGYQDTLGRSGTAKVVGSISGNSITAQYADFDPSCASRTNLLTGTVGSSSMILQASALPGGSCAAYSGYEMTFTLATPITYTASGTYTYLSSSKTVTLNTGITTFTGDRGPVLGASLKTGVTVSATTLTWDSANALITWKRESGTENNITGTWTTVNPSGNSSEFTFNADFTFSHRANIITSASGNPRVFSRYRSNGYVVQAAYDDPTPNATSVVVTGPGITSSLSLQYSASCGGSGGCWNSWSPSGSPAQLGTTPPTPPISYAFTILDASTTKTATASVGCFMESLPSNLAVSKDPSSGNLTFTWTRAYPTNPSPNLKYHIQIGDSAHSIVWNSQSVIDANTIMYTSPALTPWAQYAITLTADAFEFNCSSSVTTTFTY